MTRNEGDETEETLMATLRFKDMEVEMKKTMESDTNSTKMTRTRETMTWMESTFSLMSDKLKSSLQVSLLEAATLSSNDLPLARLLKRSTLMSSRQRLLTIFSEFQEATPSHKGISPDVSQRHSILTHMTSLLRATFSRMDQSFLTLIQEMLFKTLCFKRKE